MANGDKKKVSRWPFVAMVVVPLAIIAVVLVVVNAGAETPDAEVPPSADCETIVTHPGTESLYREPANHKGSCFRWSGRVTQRLSDMNFVVQTGFYAPYSDGRIAVYGTDECVQPGTSLRILEGDFVSFVGEFMFIGEYQMVSGPSQSWPSVDCRVVPNEP